jgi:uncharacterized protein (TIGR00369 family)
MSELKMELEAMSERLASAPFGNWLGVRFTAFDGDTLSLEVPWRDDFIGTPGTHIAHGGVLAAIVDTAGSYAIAASLGKPVPTIDLRIDYLRPVVNEAMVVTSRVLRLGRSLARAEVSIYTSQGKLAVSGTGLYSVA